MNRGLIDLPISANSRDQAEPQGRAGGRARPPMRRLRRTWSCAPRFRPAACAESIGDPQVRNRGTLAVRWPTTIPRPTTGRCAGLGATSSPTAQISATTPLRDVETALGRGEMVTQVLFPIPQQAATRSSNPATRYALVGVCVAQFKTGVRWPYPAPAHRLSPGGFRGRAERRVLRSRAGRVDRFLREPERRHACRRRLPCTPGERHGPPRRCNGPRLRFGAPPGAKASRLRRGRTPSLPGRWI